MTDHDPGQRWRVAPGKPIKLVIWDLDDTLWRGTLLEGGATQLSTDVAEVVSGLDARGVLQSIASRNDADLAMERLRQFGLETYFLAPEIGWNSKASAIGHIAKSLDLGLDSILFVDDQPFEREEVVTALPAVRTASAENLGALLNEPLLSPAVVTPEARRRRLAYREQAARIGYEREFVGPAQAFLQTLDLKLVLSAARTEDLARAEELIQRTSQLNSTGVVYSLDQLQALLASPDHQVLLARLSDRFGDYGAIGLMVLATSAAAWRLKLLVVSCRVLSRGVGSVLLEHLMGKAYASGAAFEAEFIATGRNRPMQIAYRFAGLCEIRREDGVQIYSKTLVAQPMPPAWFQITELVVTGEFVERASYGCDAPSIAV